MIGWVPNGWRTLYELAHEVGCSYEYAVRSHAYRWTHSDPQPRVILPKGAELDLDYVYLNPAAFELMTQILRVPSNAPGYPERDYRAALAYVRVWMKMMNIDREVMTGLAPLPEPS